MAIVETGKLVDGDRLRLAVRAFREAGEQGLTRVKLAEAMGHVILRTADRAREVMEREGAKFTVRSEPRTREKIFVMVKGPKWDETISRETRLALRVAAMTLGHGGNSTLEKQLEALEELTDKSLTDKDRKIFERLRRNIRVTGGVSEHAGEMHVEALETVFKAFSADIPRQLELDYQKPDGANGRRITFSPYCLSQDLFSGGTFVLGEDAEKHQVMQLRISRILSAKVINRPVIFLREAELKRAAEYQIGGWVSSEQPFAVTLRLEGSSWIKAMEEARPDFPGFRIVRKGSHAMVSFQANATEGLVRWILQLGPSAEVLEPETLRELVKKDVEAMGAKYQ
jgi:predicted DNA-binding transcriptional regulator YafY